MFLEQVMKSPFPKTIKKKKNKGVRQRGLVKLLSQNNDRLQLLRTDKNVKDQLLQILI